MRVAIITVAGISSRFNKDVPDENKVLKCLYTEGKSSETLLFKMVSKLSYADKIVVVGGYKYQDLVNYIDEWIPYDLKSKMVLVYNEHFEDLASGYSLFIGLDSVFEIQDNIDDILFVEGDLDIDSISVQEVIKSDKTVLTYNFEPIFANKAVVLYRNEYGKYKYAFNSAHGLLKIGEPFSVMYNSGQFWKFADIDALRTAYTRFEEGQREGTNLVIIQEYLNNISSDNVDVLPLKRWTNCNTREDYKKIKEDWDNEIS